MHTPPPPASTATAERIDRTGAWAWAAWAVALAAAIALACAPFELLLEHILYEDFFYYLGVADHVVRGDGATFDGTAPTNGFHPMWMAVCVLLEAVTDRTLAVRLSRCSRRPGGPSLVTNCASTFAYVSRPHPKSCG